MILLAAIFLAPLLFAHSSWAASCWALGLVVGAGWLQAASRGTLGRIPLPLAALAGWALAHSLMLLWTLSLTGGVTMVAIGSTMIPYQVIPVMFQMGGVLLALATVQWVSGWTYDQSVQAMNVLRWTLTSLVVLGILQALNLDQFNEYASRNASDVVGGTLGNPSLFAGLLAMSLPLWLTWRHRLSTWVAAVAVGLILWTSSITAVLAMLIAVWWVACLSQVDAPSKGNLPKRWRFALLISAACVVGAVALWLRPNTLTYFSPSGRFDAWAALWKLWKATTPITGLGLGAVFSLASSVLASHPLHGWQHAHNEYLMLLTELGVIGVGLFLWVVRDTGCRLRKLTSHQAALYGGPLIASAILSVTGFPWHLAQTGFLILLAHARISSETI